MRGLLVLGLILLLMACGQKGDLYLPDETARSAIQNIR